MSEFYIAFFSESKIWSWSYFDKEFTGEKFLWSLEWIKLGLSMLCILWTLKSVPQENKLVETPYKKSALVTLGKKQQTNKQKTTHLFGFSNFRASQGREKLKIFFLWI